MGTKLPNSIGGGLLGPAKASRVRKGGGGNTMRAAKRTCTTKKKLTCSGRATNSSCWQRHQHGSGGERLELHSVAKVGQTFDQAFFLLVGGTAIEVIAAEVLIHRPILEHVVDGGKDGGGDGHYRLLGAAPGFDAVELGLQVAVFLFYCRPGALHQRGFEPGSTFAQAIGSTFAGTLVVTRTYASP